MNFFSTFIIVWILVALVTFIYLFYVDAPYGRHIRTGWGKNISARVGWVVIVIILERTLKLDPKEEKIMTLQRPLQKPSMHLVKSLSMLAMKL